MTLELGTKGEGYTLHRTIHSPVMTNMKFDLDMDAQF